MAEPVDESFQELLDCFKRMGFNTLEAMSYSDFLLGLPREEALSGLRAFTLPDTPDFVEYAYFICQCDMVPGVLKAFMIERFGEALLLKICDTPLPSSLKEMLLRNDALALEQNGAARVLAAWYETQTEMPYFPAADVAAHTLLTLLAWIYLRDSCYEQTASAGGVTEGDEVIHRLCESLQGMEALLPENVHIYTITRLNYWNWWIADELRRNKENIGSAEGFSPCPYPENPAPGQMDEVLLSMTRSEKDEMRAERMVWRDKDGALQCDSPGRGG